LPIISPTVKNPSTSANMIPAVVNCCRLIPPTIYYSRVALEMGRIVFKARQMNPPPMDAFQSYFNSIYGHVRNPASLLSASSSMVTQSMNPMAMLRGINRQQFTTAGIILAEVLGFFTVGEMIGKLKIVGYRSSEVKPAEGI